MAVVRPFDVRLTSGLIRPRGLHPPPRHSHRRVQDGAVLRLPALSPNRRWLAYTSNETQRVEVFVRPLTGDGKWQISIQGGTQPVWSRDGKTLYYRADRHIMAATIGSGRAFSVTDRRPIAEDHFAFENTINYDAMPDGRLVVLVPVDEGLQLNVIVNWAEELAKRTSAPSTAR